MLGQLKTVRLNENLSKCRVSELFNMVAEFPDSYETLCELRDCVMAVNGLGDVGKVFRATVCKRLLHVGASTNQILDMYILMIKALRVLDSSEILLNYVASPVRQYLMSRKDTVRCIIESMIEQKDSDLYGELKKGGSLEYGPDEDDEESGPGENWMPTQRNLQLREANSQKGLDILGVLVSIYGSTDVFVQEYRNILAEKLLGNATYGIDEEIATLELLKIRSVLIDASTFTLNNVGVGLAMKLYNIVRLCCMTLKSRNELITL